MRDPPSVSFWPWERFSQFTRPKEFEARLFAAGDVVRTPASMGLPEMTFPARAASMRAVLQREGDLSATTAIAGFGDLIGEDSMLYMKAEQHRSFRGGLAPAFTFDAINVDALPSIAASVRRALEGAAAATAAGGKVGGYDMFKRMTFEIILNVMMGKEYADAEVDNLRGLFTQFTAGMHKFPLIDLGPLNAYGRGMAARRALLARLGEDVRAARARAAAGGEVPGQLGAMLRAVPEDGGRGDAIVSENLLGLLFAGHDTTSTALTQLFGTLSKHPEVMDKLREEQRRLVAKHGGGVSTGLIKDMAYAEAVIR